MRSTLLPHNARRARHRLGQATSHAIAGPLLAGAVSAVALTGGGVAVAAVAAPPLEALPADAAAQAQSQADADAAGEQFLTAHARAQAAARSDRLQAERDAKAKAKAEAEAEAAAEAERKAAADRAGRAASRDPKGLAAGLAAERGWGADQFSCLDSLWTKESGWKHTADNPTSSAYGIPQALPGSKMASAGADWETNPGTQIEWGLGYIADTYGTPCAAWSHSQANNWY